MSARNKSNECLTGAIRGSRVRRTHRFRMRFSMPNARRNPTNACPFPPWFLTKELVRKINQLLPYYYHMRFRLYFDRYGCIRCGRKNVVYRCGGLCVPCNGLINDRLKRTDIAMKRRHGTSTNIPSKAFLKRLTSAREILADIRRQT